MPKIQVNGFEWDKPDIDDKKDLTELEKIIVKNALKDQGCRLIHCELNPLKNDYNENKDRGTVEYTTKCRNYSFHKVIIPDGTNIYDCNFTQDKHNTNCITGKDLTFYNCNLRNVVIHGNWTLINCNNYQEDLL